MSVVERALDKLRRTAGAEGQSEGPESIIGSTQPPAATAAAPTDQRLEPKVFVDREALRAAGYLPESNLDRRFADEYRHIKRKLLATAFAEAPANSSAPSLRLVMMASALPGDGKTFTSINLALSLARERDTSVVLIDGDVAKPHVSNIFGVESALGLLDALADPGIDLNGLILPTDIKGLSILPSGKPREHATEMLSSGRMAEVADRIIGRNPHCIALFDSSPLLSSSESLALAASMGQVVIVVRAGHTPRQAMLDAIDALEPEKPISLVLNQGRRGFTEGYYGYGYGYGQGGSGEKGEG